MNRFRAAQIAGLTLIVALSVGCERATGVPDDQMASTDPSQEGPFHRAEGSRGISPSRSLVPGVNNIPEGTPITIRLQDAVSSTSSKAGDGFGGTLDDPIVIEGQELVSRGTSVTGKVLASKASGGMHNPGYLRIALVSIKANGQPVPIETSSLFVKGGSHGRRHLTAIRDAGMAGTNDDASNKEVTYGGESRLTFRLAQAVELH